jgi:hypothetical protein
MLSGKKTYITAALMALATFARTMDWLSPEQFELLMALAGSLGLAALRAGINKTDH